MQTDLHCNKLCQILRITNLLKKTTAKTCTQRSLRTRKWKNTTFGLIWFSRSSVRILKSLGLLLLITSQCIQWVCSMEIHASIRVSWKRFIKRIMSQFTSLDMITLFNTWIGNLVTQNLTFPLSKTHRTYLEGYLTLVSAVSILNTSRIQFPIEKSLLKKTKDQMIMILFSSIIFW